MALYFKSKADAFQALRVGDSAVELYGTQTRANLVAAHGDPAKVFASFTPEQRTTEQRTKVQKAAR